MAEPIGDVWTTTVTIADSASLSGASAALRGRLVAIITDSAFDTNAVTFQVSHDASTYTNLYNEGTEYSIAGVVASAYNRVDAAMFYGARTVKVRSGTAASAVNQSGATVVTLVCWSL
jgi:hypothetical protein